MTFQQGQRVRLKSFMNGPTWTVETEQPNGLVTVSRADDPGHYNFEGKELEPIPAEPGPPFQPGQQVLCKHHGPDPTPMTVHHVSGHGDVYCIPDFPGQPLCFHHSSLIYTPETHKPTFHPGQQVRLRAGGSHPTMTVLAYEGNYTYGTWVDPTGEFEGPALVRTDYLEPVPDNPPAYLETKNFDPGEMVRLRSGGPTMTVSGINISHVFCTWFADEKTLNKEPFHPSTLVKVTHNHSLGKV